MKKRVKRKLPDLACEVLNFARNDQSFAVQASLPCASSTKACGQGFVAGARSSKPCRDTSWLRCSGKKLRRCVPVADASEQKAGAKSVKPCRLSKRPRSYSSSSGQPSQQEAHREARGDGLVRQRANCGSISPKPARGAGWAGWAGQPGQAKAAGQAGVGAGEGNRTLGSSLGS